MSSQGLKSVFPMEDIAVMGLLELLPHLNKLRVSVIGLLSKSIIFVSFNILYFIEFIVGLVHPGICFGQGL